MLPCNHWGYDQRLLQTRLICTRTPDKMCISVSIMPISSPNLMLNHLLESSHQDDSNKWSNIEFDEEKRQVESIDLFVCQ